MRLTFYLFYDIPAGSNFMAMVDELIGAAIGGVVAAKGGEEGLVIWFDRDGYALPDAVVAAMKDVARVLPKAKFDFATDNYDF